MKGDIVEVDYAKTNNLGKSCGINGKYIKKTVGYISPYREKGMGSAGGTSGNPKFPGWDPTKSPGEGYEWRGKGYRIYPDGSITPKNYEGEICYA